jgi:hypothetical protein
MTHDTSSFKKVAVLTGLTAVIGGAEISNADAATTSQTDAISLITNTTATEMLPFNGFDPALGTLTGVELSVVTFVSVPPGSSATTSVQIFGNTFPVNSTNFNKFDVNGVSGSATLADYIGGSFDAEAILTGGPGFVGWSGIATAIGEGLTVTYTYTPTTPLPTTLPLFAGGLAALGFTTWRSRRKQAAKE